MAALVTIISGRYSSTYTIPSGSPVDLGVTNDPGYKLSFTPDWELVKDTDAYGANVIEAIWLGLSQVAVDWIGKEIKAGPYSVITQYGTMTTTGANTFTSGLVGRRGTDLAGSLIMSATASTPAAATPASMTFLYAQIHEGVNVDMVFGPRHRTIPIRVRIIANGTTVANYFTATAIWGIGLAAGLLGAIGGLFA